MDVYTQRLLVMAVEAAERGNYQLAMSQDGHGQWGVSALAEGKPWVGAVRTTLAAALTALLTDLGVEVPAP